MKNTSIPGTPVCAGFSVSRLDWGVACTRIMRGRSLVFDHRPSYPLQCRDGECRVVTDQVDIARTKREIVVRCWTSLTKSELHPTKNRL